MAQQKSFFPKTQKQHGGSLAVGKRRSRRPLNSKLSHHVTLKSEHAIGARSLLRHKKMILGLIHKNSQYFKVKVYETSVNSNHLHLLVKGHNRESIQNFFRVVAGHIAQRILRDFPISVEEKKRALSKRGGAPHSPNKNKAGCKKNQRKFWSFLVYSRIVTWGREFFKVLGYIRRNTLEALQLIAYQPRQKRNQARIKVLTNRTGQTNSS